jgi:hypothetical protein
MDPASDVRAAKAMILKNLIGKNHPGRTFCALSRRLITIQIAGARPEALARVSTQSGGGVFDAP